MGYVIPCKDHSGCEDFPDPGPGVASEERDILLALARVFHSAIRLCVSADARYLS